MDSTSDIFASEAGGEAGREPGHEAGREVEGVVLVSENVESDTGCSSMGISSPDSAIMELISSV